MYALLLKSLKKKKIHGIQNRDEFFNDQTLRFILKIEWTETQGHLDFLNWPLIPTACFRYLPHFCATKHAYTNQRCYIPFTRISAKELYYF